MLTLEAVDGVTVVHFDWSAILDETEISRIGGQLCDLLRNQLRPKILLDMSSARRVSSQLVSVLLTADLRAKKAGGRLAMAGIGPDLAKVLHLTGLDQVFHIFPSKLEALESFF